MPRIHTGRRQLRYPLVATLLSLAVLLARASRADEASLLRDASPDSVLDHRGNDPGTRVSRILTLESALDLTLHFSPRLEQSAWRVRAAAGRALDAGRRPNPILGATAENWGGSLGSERIESTVEIGQKLEMGGDRRARAAVARAEVLLSSAEFGVESRGLIGEVVTHFLDAWLAQQRRWSQREAVRLASEAVQAAGERIRAGAASTVERLRAQSVLVLREAELRRAEGEWQVARRTLALDWGMAQAPFDSLLLMGSDLSAPGSVDSLVSELQRHPERLRIDAETQVAEARLREARAARTPDLEARLGVRHLNEVNGTGLVAGIALPLPLWNTQRGALGAAEAERSATRGRAQAISRRLESELRSDYDRLLSAIDVYAEVRDRALPAADEALIELRAGYRAGRLNYLDLAEGQRTALETRLLALESEREIWSARLALERLVHVTPAPVPKETR